jgi:hypothetical protein
MTDMHPRDALKERLVAAGDSVIYGLIDGLAALGSSQDQWDSESIEILLSQIEAPLKTIGVPSIGDTESDWDAYAFWYQVENGEAPPDPDDPYHGSEEDARADWKYEVSNGDTELGFRDWWVQNIETARANGGEHA